MYSRWFVILFFLPLLTGQSQPPAPAPRETSQDKQQGAASKENKADEYKSPPVSVSIVNAPVTKDSAQPEHDSPPSDWWIRILTGVIAFATIAQAYIYWRQKNLMQEALIATTTAANAARDSADAAKNSFIASYRPKLAVKFVSTVSEIDEVGQGISGDFLVFNTGGTRANLHRYYSEIVFADSLPTRSKQYVEGLGEGPSDIVLHPGQSGVLKFPTGGPQTLDFDERRSIRDRQESAKANPSSGTNWAWSNLFLIGWIGYIDDSNTPRRAGFCRKYDFTAKRFVVDADPDYEYED
jgi:hypothetical protein